MISRRAVTAALFLWASAAPAVLALGPQDVYILVNKNVADSQAVADYYCAKRGVPKDHVVALDLPAGEDIGRADYDAKLAGPLRSQFKDKRDKVKVLLTVYGVPLRVGPKEPNADEKAELEKVKKELEPLEKKRKELDEAIKGLEAKVKDEPKGQAADDLAARRKDRAGVENQIRPAGGPEEIPLLRREHRGRGQRIGPALVRRLRTAPLAAEPAVFPGPGGGAQGQAADADDLPARRAERGTGQADHRPVGGDRGQGAGRQGVRGRPRHRATTRPPTPVSATAATTSRCARRRSCWRRKARCR